jgi:Putative Ig domain
MLSLKSWRSTACCALVLVSGMIAGCGGSSDSSAADATAETASPAGSTTPVDSVSSADPTSSVGSTSSAAPTSAQASTTSVAPTSAVASTTSVAPTSAVGSTSSAAPTSSTSPTSSASSTPTVSSDKLTITGTPGTTVVAGQAYSFRPSAFDSSGKAVQYGVAGKPAWASFNQSTGALTGTPTTADVGVNINVRIAASDGTTSATLPAFEITVNPAASSASTAPSTPPPSSSAPSANSTQGSVTVGWAAPTENTNGSALTNLSGFKVYYGTASKQYTQSVTVSSPSVLSQLISSLTVGQTYFFAVAAVSSAGVESSYSPEVSATIT